MPQKMYYSSGCQIHIQNKDRGNNFNCSRTTEVVYKGRQKALGGPPWPSLWHLGARRTAQSAHGIVSKKKHLLVVLQVNLIRRRGKAGLMLHFFLEINSNNTVSTTPNLSFATYHNTNFCAFNTLSLHGWMVDRNYNRKWTSGRGWMQHYTRVNDICNIYLKMGGKVRDHLKMLSHNITLITTPTCSSAKTARITSSSPFPNGLESSTIVIASQHIAFSMVLNWWVSPITLFRNTRAVTVRRYGICTAQKITENHRKSSPLAWKVGGVAADSALTCRCNY